MMSASSDSTQRSERVALRSLPRANGHNGSRYAIEGCVDGFAFTLPVRFELRRSKEHPLAEVYMVEICGMRLERNRLNALLQAVEDALEEWQYAGRLPRYAFLPAGVAVANRHGHLRVQVSRDSPHVTICAGSSDLPEPFSTLLPVYPSGKAFKSSRAYKKSNALGFPPRDDLKGWQLHEMDAPIFEADDLGILRKHLADYLAWPAGRLTLLALSPSLTWEAPLCIMQPIEREIPWLPVYALNGTLSIRAEGREFAVSRNGGEEIFDLLQQVTAFLVQSGTVHDSNELMLTNITSEEWAVLAPHLRQNGVTLGYYDQKAGKLEKNPVPVYENSHGLVAAHCHGNTLSLFMGADPLSLKRRVADSLWKRDVISSPEHLFLKHNS